jgi:phosphoribosylamine---glycine ligase
VLSVAVHGETLQEAVARVYDAAARISFEGMHYRRDIAHRGLRHKSGDARDATP